MKKLFRILNSETGLNKEAFEELFIVLYVNEECTNIKFYDSKLKFMFIESSSESLASPENKKQGPKVKLGAKDQLLLIMSWLKGGFSLWHIS